MALDYYLDIEGIDIRLSTKVFTGLGDGYTYIDCIRGLSSVSYELDPIELTASVGVLELRLIDEVTSTYAHGVLTDLFGWRQPDSERLYLDTTIQEGDAMAGAGTIDVHANIANTTYPITFFIETEAFTATGDDGAAQFTGVTREVFGTIAGRHVGYSLPNGYRPLVSFYPRFWLNRWAKLCVVVDDAAQGGAPTNDAVVWQGPISSLTPSGLPGWTLRVGSIMRIINKRKVLQGNRPLTNGDPMLVSSGPIWEISLKGAPKVLREGLSLTADGNDGAASDVYATCTQLTEPDDFWTSRNALHWTSGNNVTTGLNVGPYDRDTVIESFDSATGVMKIQNQENNTITGDDFELIEWNSYPARSEFAAFWAVIDEELIFLQVFDDATSTEAFSITIVFQATRAYHGFANTMHDRDAPLVGLEGCQIADHGGGEVVREVLSNHRYDVGSLAVVDISDDQTNKIQFDFAHAFMTKRHPIEWLLEVLTSTGTGTPVAAGHNGDHDLLPPHHGASIPADWIDIDGIMKVKQACESDTYRLAYTAPLALKDLVNRDICAPLGLYPAVDKEGKFTLKRIQFSDPSASVATITEDHISADKPPAFEQGHSGIISSIIFKHDWQPFTEDYKGYTAVKWTDADEIYPLAGSIEFETHIWLGADHPGASGHITHDQMSAILERNAIRTLKRASSPLWLLRLNLPLTQSLGTLSAFELRPGDVCTVTLGEVPLPDGTRGLSGDILEVVAVRINPLEGTVDVTLWLSLYDFKPGGWNWSAEVNAWDAGNDKATVDADLFLSGEDVTDYVEVGDEVRIHYCAQSRAGGGVPYGNTEELTISAVTAATVTFDAAPANALVAGDVLSVPDYDTSTTAQKVNSHWAKANAAVIGDETLGAADDPPKVWV